MAIGKLTHARIAKRTKPGMEGDGGGLWMFYVMRKDGTLSKRWRFRHKKHGIDFETPIGPWPDVTLADARVRRAEFHAMIARGENPAATRKNARTKAKTPAIGAITFRQAARDFVAIKGKEWRTAAHAFNFLNSLERHLPSLLDRPIAEISDAEVLADLAPLFARSPDLGKKIAARARLVFDRARAMKQTSNPNPFAWKDQLSHVFPSPPPDRHMAAIPWQKLPGLFALLVGMGDDPVALAARFQIALALRPTEARMARFDMIDADAATITFTITKNGKQFTAPLNAAALAVVERCEAMRMGDYLFPGRSGGRKPICDGAVVDLIQSFHPGATAHGVARSCFADWAYTNEAGSAATIEAALNHSIGSATVKAYMRSDLLPLRRKLGQAYSAFLTGESNVIAFPLAAASAAE